MPIYNKNNREFNLITPRHYKGWTIVIFPHLPNLHNLVIFLTNSPSDSYSPKDDASDCTMLFLRVDMYGCLIIMQIKKNVIRLAVSIN